MALPMTAKLAAVDHTNTALAPMSVADRDEGGDGLRFGRTRPLAIGRMGDTGITLFWIMSRR